MSRRLFAEDHERVRQAKGWQEQIPVPAAPHTAVPSIAPAVLPEMGGREQVFCPAV